MTLVCDPDAARWSLCESETKETKSTGLKPERCRRRSSGTETQIHFWCAEFKAALILLLLGERGAHGEQELLMQRNTQHKHTSHHRGCKIGSDGRTLLYVLFEQHREFTWYVRRNPERTPERCRLEQILWKVYSLSHRLRKKLQSVNVWEAKMPDETFCPLKDDLSKRLWVTDVDLELYLIIFC